MEKIMDDVYDGNRRRVTPEVLKHIDALAFSLWFLDDGSLSNHSHKKGKVRCQGSLAIQGFTLAEVELVDAWLCDFLGVDK